MITEPERHASAMNLPVGLAGPVVAGPVVLAEPAATVAVADLA